MEKYSKKNMGDRIKRIRLRRGLTQKALAEKAGLSESALRSYELGDRFPKDAHLERVARALGVRPEVFSGADVTTRDEFVHLLLAMEDGMRLEPVGDELRVGVGSADRDVADALREWRRMRDRLEAGEISREQYEDWRDGFTTGFLVNLG